MVKVAIFSKNGQVYPAELQKRFGAAFLMPHAG